MNKYKVEFTVSSTFVVDVLAKTQEEAETLAESKWHEIDADGTAHYHEVGDQNVAVSQVYDVTNTDDPFNP